MRLDGFEIFRERVRLKFSLTVCSALHVGAPDVFETGRYFPARMARDICGLPYIPATTLRGALRRAVESVIAGLSAADEKGKLRCCGLAKAERCDPSDPCDVCQLFGSPAKSSRIALFDAPAAAPVELGRQAFFRFRLPVDRETMVGKEEAGRAFEYAPAAMSFQCEAELANPESYELGLIFMALDMLDEGLVRLGGKGSAGAGRVKVFVAEVERINAGSIMAAARTQAGDRAAETPSAAAAGAEKAELAAPIRDLLEIVGRRRGEVPAGELQQAMTTIKGWSNQKYREAGFKDLGKLIEEAQRLGLVAYVQGRVKMIYGAKPGPEEAEAEKGKPFPQAEESELVKMERKMAREALLRHVGKGG